MRPSLLQVLALRVRLLLCRFAGRELPVEARYLGSSVHLRVTGARELRRALELHDETDLLEAMVERIEPEDVIYDVGANIGLVSLALALHPRGRESRVVAFEPEPGNLERLRANLEANGLGDRVEGHGVALGAEDGSVGLHVRGGPGEGRHSIVDDRKALEAISVPLRRAASLAEEGVPVPDVAKIDVEGAEGAVLEGMAPLIREGRPRELFLEVHEKGQGDRMPDGRSLHDWLESHGYRLAWTAHRRTRDYRHYTNAGDPVGPDAGS